MSSPLWNTLSLTVVRVGAYLQIFIGVLIITAASFVYVYDWGSVDVTFLEGPCYLVMLMGIIMIFESLIGLQGLRLLYTRSGVFSSAFLLSIFITVLFGCVIVEAWALSQLYKMNDRFYSIVVDLLAGKTVPVILAELYFSKTFNRLFFASANTCTSFSALSLWSFVKDHCPNALQRKYCGRCFVYSASSCVADQNTCYSSSEFVQQCPYMVCRLGFLSFFNEKMNLAVSIIIALVVYEFVLACAILYIILISIVSFEREPETRKLMMVRRDGPPPLIEDSRLSYRFNNRVRQDIATNPELQL